ncbi:type II secretion system protein [Candidatus Kaiserbacteria bacterium]|nr:type II secretion system protein [Candidatus Kaiserbacteria bacterium]USN91885.1 MAG: type II secretion system protein [Candidatus Nomurabacteria bacterium]
MNFYKNKTNTTGFSLIEVMIVTSIIGILATYGTFSYNETKKQARDVRRMEDLTTIAKAFVLAEEDRGRAFDCDSGVRIEPGFMSADNNTVVDCSDKDEIQSALAKYLGKIPSDPKGPGDARYFYYYSNHDCLAPQSKGYLVHGAMENDSNSNRDQVCGKKVNGTDAGLNNEGYYNYNTGLGVANHPFVVRVGDL